MSPPSVLESHGTALVVLTPGSILAAASADLIKFTKKREKRLLPFEPYAFHRAHVRKVDTEAELIALALKERTLGQTSGKRITREVYGNEVLLQEALAAARGGRG